VHSFQYIWTLFEPGHKIYRQSYLSEMQMFEVQSVQMDPENTQLTIWAAAFDWDGDDFRRYAYAFSIPAFEGSKSIINLPCFPVSYYKTESDPDGSEMKAKLLDRGKRFYQICMEQDIQYEYEGPLLYNDNRPNFGGPGDPADPFPPPRRILRTTPQQVNQTIKFGQQVRSSSFVAMLECLW
jgi:hypothetical protein